MVGFGEIVGVLATVGSADNARLQPGAADIGMLQYDALFEKEVV